MYEVVDGAISGTLVGSTAKTDTTRLCLEYCKREPSANFFSWDAGTGMCECLDDSQWMYQSTRNNYKIL